MYRVLPGSSWRKELCYQAVKGLQHLCQTAEGKTAIREAGALSVLARLCSVAETGSEEVVQAATAALALLTVDPHAKVCA